MISSYSTRGIADVLIPANSPRAIKPQTSGFIFSFARNNLSVSSTVSIPISSISILGNSSPLATFFSISSFFSNQFQAAVILDLQFFTVTGANFRDFSQFSNSLRLISCRSLSPNDSTRTSKTRRTCLICSGLAFSALRISRRYSSQASQRVNTRLDLWFFAQNSHISRKLTFPLIDSI